MTVFLADPDVTLWHGDVLETLRGMPDGSVDCVVTSPPYWGLRDYGTGAWEGGDPDCDHLLPGGGKKSGPIHGNVRYETSTKAQLESCRKCGARRTDNQLGLEPTPDLFVARMVEVFREVRRVLAAHGTCWVNLGDSYNAATSARRKSSQNNDVGYWQQGGEMGDERLNFPGLKPKDLCGLPWRVAFALQADGWYLRSDIVWAKPNPMPESVTDRPTKAHEYVFLLTKQPRYWFDAEAVREPHRDVNRPIGANGLPEFRGKDGPTLQAGNSQGWNGRGFTHAAREYNPAGRNVRSVWEIPTQPYPEAHFATYPEELVRRCLLAGCPEAVCRTCGKPRERIVERGIDDSRPPARRNINPPEVTKAGQGTNANGSQTWGHWMKSETLGWSDCGHNNYRPGRVLDPFIGSGTTAHVARKHGRHAIGIDLNADYLALAARRLQQQSLFADVAP